MAGDNKFNDEIEIVEPFTQSSMIDKQKKLEAVKTALESKLSRDIADDELKSLQAFADDLMKKGLKRDEADAIPLSIEKLELELGRNLTDAELQKIQTKVKRHNRSKVNENGRFIERLKRRLIKKERLQKLPLKVNKGSHYLKMK